MFGRKPDPEQRRKVLELLTRWSSAIARIDSATDTMRLVIAKQPLGMQSDECEKARLAAIAIVEQVQKETTNPRFWPVLEDNNGAKIMWELKAKLEESYGHQLNLLNLYGIAASAFRSGRDSQAPSVRGVESANKAFARILDQMGSIAGKLARHYRISSQDYQQELRR